MIAPNAALIQPSQGSHEFALFVANERTCKDACIAIANAAQNPQQLLSQSSIVEGGLAALLVQTMKDKGIDSETGKAACLAISNILSATKQTTVVDHFQELECHQLFQAWRVKLLLSQQNDHQILTAVDKSLEILDETLEFEHYAEIVAGKLGRPKVFKFSYSAESTSFT
ncbi:hypothetical protein BKA70DRAFT_1285529 [Coprinopsis sp. MPI-PUGE-AT-0042]|nr:hypothetical protein BKA70DRAFT_1285529 [Coprinopsis sp. MPI-PUGE-AT-0042]